MTLHQIHLRLLKLSLTSEKLRHGKLLQMLATLVTLVTPVKPERSLGNLQKLQRQHRQPTLLLLLTAKQHWRARQLTLAQQRFVRLLLLH